MRMMHLPDEYRPSLTDTQIADYCERAADYMEEHGWVKQKYEDADGNVCAIGALHRVAGCGNFGYDESGLTTPGEYLKRLSDVAYIAERLTDILPIGGDDEPMSLIDWSDEKGEQIVIDGLRYAAQRLRGDDDGRDRNR